MYHSALTMKIYKVDTLQQSINLYSFEFTYADLRKIVQILGQLAQKPSCASNASGPRKFLSTHDMGDEHEEL